MTDRSVIGWSRGRRGRARADPEPGSRGRWTTRLV